MTPITFWFDPVSPYAHLAFEHLPQALEGHSVVVDYKPVVFGALLKHHAHKGPAEIEPKREWTFRQVAWLGHTLGVRIDLPAQHPFNSLPLLRLMLAAAGPGALPNRRICEQVLRHVWHGGADPLDPERLAELEAAIGLPAVEAPHQGQDAQAANAAQAPQAAQAVRDQLRALTDEAIVKGIFGVPTLECRGRLFWGLDALPMLRAQLDGDPWFDTHWDTAARKVPGVVRSTK